MMSYGLNNHREDDERVKYKLAMKLHILIETVSCANYFMNFRKFATRPLC